MPPGAAGERPTDQPAPGGLGFGGQLAVGAAIAALVVLSGGSLGIGFGVSGVATYSAAKAHGLATFARDPGAATRAYLATAEEILASRR